MMQPSTWGTPAQFWGGGRGTHTPPSWGREAAQDRLCAPLPGLCPLLGDSCPDPTYGWGDPAWERSGGAPALPPGSRDLYGHHRTLPYGARHVPPPRQAALYRCPLQAGLWPGVTLPAETGRRLQETLGPRPGSHTMLQPRSLHRDPERPPSPVATPASPRGCFGGCRTLRSL